MNTFITTGENVLKVSLLAYGAVDGAFAIAKENNLIITDEIPLGTKLRIPELDLNLGRSFLPFPSNLDLILDDDLDLKIEEGDFVLGDTEIQEVELNLRLNRGEILAFPEIGANLTELQNGIISNDKINKSIRNSLYLDGKDYENLKEKININVIS